MSQKAIDNIRRWREHPDQFVREVFGVIPDAWQDDVLQAFPNHQRMAMKAPLCLTNIVSTPEGHKLWGDVVVGDKLFAENGSVTLVTARFDTGIKPIYRVTFRDGSWVDACADHLWKVQTPYDRKTNKTRELTTKQILQAGLKFISGQRRFNIPQQGAAQYTEKKLPLNPYVFGLWIGDGSKDEPAIICPDPEIRKAIEKRGYKTSLKKNGKGLRVLDSVQAFKDTQINHLYCYEKFIPDVYKFGSIEQRLELLRGMMDADGTTAKNGHTYYASSSVMLIEDIIWLARSLGYLANKMGPYKIKNGEFRDSYRAVITGKMCPFSANTSKKKRWGEPDQFRYTRFIESIKLIGQRECMCVSVAHPSSCFLANDFIVTHNCKGPGKTALLAWLAWNFLLTRPYPKIAATSITGDNLADNLWAEMAKWQQKSELLKSTFTWTKTRIFCNESPETWWMSARPWSKSADPQTQGEALAGLHADYIMFLLDESGGIPDSVMASAEAALSSCVEGHLVQAGNPTNLEGPLYRACTSERRLWHVTEITSDPDDPKRTPRVKAEWAREQIEKYGRDNPWVLINVFGQFPPSSLNSLIGPDEVAAAMRRDYKPQDYISSGKVLGVDVARFGSDSSVMFPRQGLQAFTPTQWRGIDGTQGANLVNRKWEEWDADAVFIDDTGGFGSSWIDNLMRIGKTPIGVHFATKNGVNDRYFNKRTEMAFECIEWIKRGGALPNIPELAQALSQTTYTFKGDKMLLEPKEIIKERLGYSPDHFDALMLTFATPVQKTFRNPIASAKTQGHQINYEYDPRS